MIETEISLDRLTIVAYDAGGIEGYLKYSGYIRSQGSSSNIVFRHAYKGLSGELLEIGDKGKVRIDFNPNKANMEQIGDILSRLKYPHLTRLDVAIDYFDIGFSNVEWADTKRRKRNYWVDGFGALETLYIGAPSSDKRFRIYDKLKERKSNSHGDWEKDWAMVQAERKGQYKYWWRVEVQKRYKESDNFTDGKEYFLPDLFDISPVSKRIDTSHIEKNSERSRLEGYIAVPELLKGADKKTRAKYTKMMQEARERSGKVLEMEPHEVYEKEKSHLADQLNDLLQKTYRPLNFT